MTTMMTTTTTMIKTMMKITMITTMMMTNDDEDDGDGNDDDKDSIDRPRRATISPQWIVVLGLAVGNEASCSPHRDPEITRDRTRRPTSSRRNPSSVEALCRPSSLLSPPPRLLPPRPILS